MIKKIFPFLDWFKTYNRLALRADAIAGLTVALVFIPQSMAYAQLAGLPTYYGLYASFLPPLVAALFGSSRQLATGPVAMVSLMTAASLAPLATAGSEGYIAYAILLSLMVGVFQLCLGILRLGLVVNFLSHPVVNGFTNAGGHHNCHFPVGQNVRRPRGHGRASLRNHLAGYSGRRSLHPLAHPYHGGGGFCHHVRVKKNVPKIPNVLVAVVITTLISWAFGFQHDAQVPDFPTLNRSGPGS